MINFTSMLKAQLEICIPQPEDPSQTTSLKALVAKSLIAPSGVLVRLCHALEEIGVQVGELCNQAPLHIPCTVVAN